MVMWMHHEDCWGRNCPTVRMPLYFGGLSHHPLRPTLIAHRDHSRRLFDGMQHLRLDSLSDADILDIADWNARVQSWWANAYIRSRPLAVLLAEATFMRPAARALLERMAARCPGQVGQPASESGGDALSAEQLEYLRDNHGSRRRDAFDVAEDKPKPVPKP